MPWGRAHTDGFWGFAPPPTTPPLLEDGTPTRHRRELGGAEPGEPPITLATGKKAKSEVLLVSEGGCRGRVGGCRGALGAAGLCWGLQRGAGGCRGGAGGCRHAASSGCSWVHAHCRLQPLGGSCLLLACGVHSSMHIVQEAACRAGSCLHALTVLQGVHMQQVGDGTCSSGSVQHCCACGRAVTPKVHICVYAVTPKNGTCVQ